MTSNKRTVLKWAWFSIRAHMRRSAADTPSSEILPLISWTHASKMTKVPEVRLAGWDYSGGVVANTIRSNM